MAVKAPITSVFFGVDLGSMMSGDIPKNVRQTDQRNHHENQ